MTCLYSAAEDLLKLHVDHLPPCDSRRRVCRTRWVLPVVSADRACSRMCVQLYLLTLPHRTTGCTARAGCCPRTLSASTASCSGSGEQLRGACSNGHDVILCSVQALECCSQRSWCSLCCVLTLLCAHPHRTTGHSCWPPCEKDNPMPACQNRQIYPFCGTPGASYPEE